MCEEYTKQKFLFLSAFEDLAVQLRKSEVRQSMSEISMKVFETEKYVNFPEPFEKLMESERCEDTIELVQADGWRLTPLGLHDRETSFRPYVEDASN